MNEQNNAQYNEPVENSQNPWVIIVSIVITALVVGGGVYAWQNSNLKSTRQSFQEQVTLLQSQINQLQQTQQSPNKQATQPSLNQDQNNQPVVDQNENTNQQVNQPQEIVYSNSQYGFSLTFPQTWKGYITKTETSNWTKGVSSAGELMGDTMITTIYFGFPAQSDIFGISVFTKEQWNKIQAFGLPNVPKKSLEESGQYVFAEVWSQATVNNEMSARRQEITSITKTFEVTK